MSLRRTSDFALYNFNLNLSKSFKQHRLYVKFDSRYEQDYHSLQSIDCFKHINKYSENFFSNKEFQHLYEPDIKNLKNLSRENSIKYQSIDSRRYSFINDGVDYMMKNKYYNYIKKRLPLFSLIAFLFFLVLLLSNS
jgi:hypothetical protein